MKLLLLISIFVTLGSMSQAGSPSNQWRITEPTWTENHEIEFGSFVARIGEAVEKRICATVDECLRSSANIFAATDPKGLRHFADCADLPYYLRAYFAWKKGLPFSIVSAVEANSDWSIWGFGKKEDVRYSAKGNKVTKRYDILSYVSALDVFNEIIPTLTFSATYRMTGIEEDPYFFDFYPVKIAKNSVRKGTVIYDPNGHVAIIYKITQDGQIYYIDAHPDNTLTSGLYTPKFVRSTPEQGAGFKNFRPLQLVGAKRDSSGTYIGGRIQGASNSQLPYFSTEQFYGNQPDPQGAWNKGLFYFNGQRVSNFYEFVRLSLASGTLIIDPLIDMSVLLDDICTNLKDRVIAVQTAVDDQIHLKDHPKKLPYNIFGSEGEWEKYASPSRDARLKESFVFLLKQTQEHIQNFKMGSLKIQYSGLNLAQDLYDIYAKKAQACLFTYQTSAGQTVKMNLEAARQRLFKLSFDPYHCPELRWGARIEGELRNCRTNADKTYWYESEQYLRNQTERTYDARMDYTAEELRRPPEGVGVMAAPDVDIVSYLRSEIRMIGR